MSFDKKHLYKEMISILMSSLSLLIYIIQNCHPITNIFYLFIYFFVFLLFLGLLLWHMEVSSLGV